MQRNRRKPRRSQHCSPSLLIYDLLRLLRQSVVSLSLYTSDSRPLYRTEGETIRGFLKRDVGVLAAIMPPSRDASSPDSADCRCGDMGTVAAVDGSLEGSALRTPAAAPSLKGSSEIGRVNASVEPRDPVDWTGDSLAPASIVSLLDSAVASEEVEAAD
jgi:hypothetical protein